MPPYLFDGLQLGRRLRFHVLSSTVITSDMSGQRGSPVSTFSLSPSRLYLERIFLTVSSDRVRNVMLARLRRQGERAPPVTPGTGSGNNPDKPEKREIKDILLVNK
ncbi:hypothetical protein CEXT_551801 [Caerostris extrusa]|uniref:Uncharacterized protein n=1 Tax=Caerostris extrusa TaxID=172846 RepID=A0AAV4R6Z0_CAEEX|nr:hypothetical protein CEXT_551801 [Caerostris extrusa]